MFVKIKAKPALLTDNCLNSQTTRELVIDDKKILILARNVDGYIWKTLLPFL